MANATRKKVVHEEVVAREGDSGHGRMEKNPVQINCGESMEFSQTDRRMQTLLTPPQVQSSSLQERIQFLQGKGLTESEIQQALAESANPAPAAITAAPVPPPTYARPAPTHGPVPNYGFTSFVPPPPEAPKRDWRDIFVSVVIPLASKRINANVSDHGSRLGWRDVRTGRSCKGGFQEGISPWTA